MSQYYLICNIDKREYLCPSEFDDGAQLCALGSGSQGILQAVAFLTSQGNGRGGGDICRTAHQGNGDFEPKEWERIESEWSRDDVLSRIIVPACMGRWAGDRVVTAGDYGDTDEFCSPVEQLRAGRMKLVQQFYYERDQYENKYPRKFDLDAWIANKPDASVNLYTLAASLYEDIGPEVKKQIAAYGEGPTATVNIEATCEHLLTRRLLNEYEHTITTGKGKNRRKKWQLHWLDPEMLDTFLRRWGNNADLNLVKTWLRKQELASWQREAIKCYRGYRDGQEQIDFKKLEQVLRDHDFIKDPEYRNRWRVQALLPSPTILDAALAVEAIKNEKTPHQPIYSDTTDQGDMERVAAQAGVHMRHRVIDLDGSGVGS